MSDTAESEAPSDDLGVAPPAVEPVAKPSAVSRAADLISRRRETTITFVTVALFCYFWIANDAFVTTNNLRVVTQFATPVAFLAIAQVMNLVGGEIDLSLGNIYAFAPFVMVSAQDWGLPLPVALVFAVTVASLVGLANGAITIMTGVPSFITTMGMLFFLNGVTLTISDAFPKTPTRGGFAEWIGGADYSGFWWALGLTVILHVLLTKTRWGVYTIATGGNPIGASEAGIQIKRIKIGNFMLAAGVAGFAGISEGIRVAHVLAVGRRSRPHVPGCRRRGDRGDGAVRRVGDDHRSVPRRHLPQRAARRADDRRDQCQHLQHHPRRRDHRLDGPQCRRHPRPPANEADVKSHVYRCFHD